MLHITAMLGDWVLMPIRIYFETGLFLLIKKELMMIENLQILHENQFSMFFHEKLFLIY
jgi:hypothetical protein